MGLIRIFPVVWTKYVQRFLYIHTGFDDRSLLRVVGGKVYHLFFIKVR